MLYGFSYQENSKKNLKSKVEIANEEDIYDDDRDLL
jgi:hypothetical protein